MMLAELVWQAPGLWPVAIAVVVGGACALLWLYPGQMRNVGGVWRWVLPALRMVAVAALGAALLRPVIVRPGEETAGTVAILIDRSKSMSVRDPRGPGQLVAVADGLGALAGVLPAGQRASADVQLLADLEHVSEAARGVVDAMGELDYAQLTGRGVEAGQRRVEAASTGFKKLTGDLARRLATMADLSQMAEVLQSLDVPASTREREGWLRDVRGRVQRVTMAVNQSAGVANAELYRGNADVRQACEAVAGLDRLGLAERALTDGAAGLLAHRAEFGGPKVEGYLFDEGVRSTELAVGRSMGAVGAEGLRTDIARAVREVLSRPRGTPLRAMVVLSDGRQTAGTGSARGAAMGEGVPIFSVDVAAMGVGRDLSVGLTARTRTAWAGEPIAARVDVRASGLRQRVVARIQLKDAQAEEGADQMRQLPMQEDSTVSTDFEMTPGSGAMAHLVASVRPIAGEMTEENNQADRWVRLSQARMKVAVVLGGSGRDGEVLRDVLGRTGWMESHVQTVFPGKKVEVGAEQIGLLDVLVLDDVAVAALSAEQREAVRERAQEGGGVVLMGSGGEWLKGYATDELLAGLLPFTGQASWKTWGGEQGGYNVVPAPEDGVQLDVDEGQSTARWKKVAPVSRYLGLQAMRATARGMLIESASGAPVVTEMPVGAGRSVLVGMDETWRWRGSGDADRFWRELLRDAAEGPYAAGDATLALDVDASAEPRQAARVRVKAVDEESGAMPALVIKKGNVVRRVALTTTAVGRYQATFSDLEAGDYQVEAQLADRRVSLPLVVRESSAAEMANVSGDERFLRSLAETTGGSFIPLARVERLPRRLADVPKPPAPPRETALWDSPYLFIFVLACLGAEWALRKQMGLA